MSELQTVNGAIGAIGAIQGRRSIRHYGAKKLDRETIGQLLSAAVLAPTAMHQEPWRFVVVQDGALLRQLSERAKDLFCRETSNAWPHVRDDALEAFSQPEFNVFYNASTLIIIGGDLSDSFTVADCWLAAENLMLAAWEMGLGSCVIGSAVSAINTAEFREKLGIPSGVTAVAPVIVGYPAGAAPESSRNKPKIIAWKANSGANGLGRDT